GRALTVPHAPPLASERVPVPCVAFRAARWPPRQSRREGYWRDRASVRTPAPSHSARTPCGNIGSIWRRPETARTRPRDRDDGVRRTRRIHGSYRANRSAVAAAATAAARPTLCGTGNDGLASQRAAARSTP